MDRVFNEEQRHLAQVEKQIDDAEQKCGALIDKLNREIAHYHPVDYEDVGRKKQMIDEQNQAVKRYSEYGKYKPSPYFARLDLDRETKDGFQENSYYIGWEGLAIYGHDVIIDWRADVGQFYYIKNQKTFNVKGFEYSLALRRAFVIKNAELISYNTEFDGTVVTLKGEVIDPFLLTVLKDKRRQHKLTDIIQTIQENQNNIIRRPIDESFVVQGCAGSGKTMILLHRLSYLKFNNKAMSLTGVKIITPNRDFDMHINDLSHELGLDSIQRMTVEEYYVYLIQRYSSELTVNAKVVSESGLNPDLLGTVYSQEFIGKLHEQYHALWDAVLWTIDEPKLREVFRIHNVKYPQTENHNALAAEMLKNGIERIAASIREDIEKKKELQRRKETVEAECAKEKEFCDQLTEETNDARSKLIQDLNDGIASFSEQIEQIKQEVSRDRETYEKLKDIDIEAAEEIRKAKDELDGILSQREFYLDFDQCVDKQDPIAAAICEKNAECIATIRSLASQIEKIPVYSFVKKNAVKKELNEAKNAFSSEARKVLDSLIKERESKLAGNTGLSEAEKQELSEMTERLEADELSLIELEKKQKAFEQCLLALSSAVNEAPVLSVGTRELVGTYLVGYENLVLSLKEHSDKLIDLQNRIGKLDEQIGQFRDEDIKYVESCEEQADRLQVKNIYKAVIRKGLIAAYYEYGEEYTKSNYRHKLFLILLLCLFHYNRSAGSDTYLNIDEAQDISAEEYNLINLVNGERCIFNLYGDINQNIYPQKGITDWGELEQLVGENIYVLNEDYRNTLQITEYCNKEFDADIFPIGVRGEEVSHMDLGQALKWLVQMKQKNPESRTVLIIKKDSEDLRATVLENMYMDDFSWLTVDDKKVSVLTVEKAKGLEFETVVVACKDMEINELYIAYTRALENLCIVKN